MKLDKHYSITRDTNNVILEYKGDPYERKVKGKLTTVTPTDKWYCASVSQALKKYIDLNLEVNKDVQTFLKSILILNNKVNSLDGKI